jgi:hypothetical protein
MALFIDAPPMDVAAIASHDSGLLETCKILGIDLSSKFALAHSEIALELTLMLNSLHVHAVPIGTNCILSLDHVALTAPLAAWQVRHTLALVYGDAYYSQLNDRYAAKWKEYQTLTRIAKDTFREIGIGIVSDPLERPAAPAIEELPTTTSDKPYYVSATVLNQSGEDSSPSTPVTAPSFSEKPITVKPGTTPPNAKFWNVYIGVDPGRLWRQNDTPLELGSGWPLWYPTIRTGGVPPSNGQEASFHKRLPRTLQRG